LHRLSQRRQVQPRPSSRLALCSTLPSLLCPRRRGDINQQR
jgi:hypothetical protein